MSIQPRGFLTSGALIAMAGLSVLQAGCVSNSGREEGAKVRIVEWNLRGATAALCSLPRDGATQATLVAASKRLDADVIAFQGASRAEAGLILGDDYRIFMASGADAAAAPCAPQRVGAAAVGIAVRPGYHVASAPQSERSSDRAAAFSLTGPGLPTFRLMTFVVDSDCRTTECLFSANDREAVREWVLASRTEGVATLALGSFGQPLDTVTPFWTSLGVELDRFLLVPGRAECDGNPSSDQALVSPKAQANFDRFEFAPIATDSGGCATILVFHSP